VVYVNVCQQSKDIAMLLLSVTKMYVFRGRVLIS